MLALLSVLCAAASLEIVEARRVDSSSTIISGSDIVQVKVPAALHVSSANQLYLDFLRQVQEDSMNFLSEFFPASVNQLGTGDCALDKDLGKITFESLFSNATRSEALWVLPLILLEQDLQNYLQNYLEGLCVPCHLSPQYKELPYCRSDDEEMKELNKYQCYHVFVESVVRRINALRIPSSHDAKVSSAKKCQDRFLRMKSSIVKIPGNMDSGMYYFGKNQIRGASDRTLAAFWKARANIVIRGGQVRAGPYFSSSGVSTSGFDVPPVWGCPVADFGGASFENCHLPQGMSGPSFIGQFGAALIPVQVFVDPTQCNFWVAQNNRGLTAHCAAHIQPLRLFPGPPKQSDLNRLNETLSPWNWRGVEDCGDFSPEDDNPHHWQRPRRMPSFDMALTATSSSLENVNVCKVACDETWS